MEENIYNLFNEFFSGTSANVKDFRPALVAYCVFNSFVGEDTISDKWRTKIFNSRRGSK